MAEYLLSLLKKLFNFPDLNKLSQTIREPINLQLKQMNKRFTYLLILIILINIFGFIAILSCLENGFHWKYLFKV